MTTVAAQPTLPHAAAFAPGVYDIPADEYHADRTSLSSSGARKLLPPSCPALFRWEQDHPQPPKKTFEIGTAAHQMVLGAGPELVVVDRERWDTNAVKAEVAAIRETGAVPLKPSQYAEIKAMAAALRAHPLAAALLDPEYGKPEQSLFWRDPETGVNCRARLDWLPDSDGGRMLAPDYKGLALDTAIPTPDGWTTMRDLKVGDWVFGSDGRPCLVTHKSEVHYRRCYRIRFDDGSSVICDDEHRWLTTSGRTGKRSKPVTAVRTTQEIRNTLKLHNQCHHRVPVAGALELPEIALPVPPYVLGCWLGDGCVNEGRITKPDTELFDRIASYGYEIGAPVGTHPTCPTRTVYGLRKQLRLAGLLGHKAIPSEYLRASAAQRLDLLRGLMDTDGSWNKQRQQAIFTTTDKALAEAVRELACSLGQRAIIHEVTAHGYGLTVQAYRVTFTPTHGLNPFALSRKADAVEVRSEVKSRQRIITAVEEMPTVPTQCISVDSPDNTYLCTESMIPTHNTSASASLRAFEKAVAEYHYDQQAEWYSDGLRRLGLADDVAFLFIVQEKTPPFLVNVIELPAHWLLMGRDRNLRARETYAACTESGVWPGYSDDVQMASPPAWLEAEHDREYR